MANPTPATRQHMLAACGNNCAYPDCSNPIFDVENECLIGELCHIKGNNPTSTRYDASQPEEERQSFANLIAMCTNHSRIIDKSPKQHLYTVETLRHWKKEHELKIARQSDRGWILPPNSIIMKDKDGVVIRTNWWKDKTGRPQIYTDEQLKITSTLLQIYLDISKTGTLLQVLTTIENDVVKSLLQQSYAKMARVEGGFVPHLFKLMATAPNITFAEFIGYLVKGGDSTPLIEAMLKKSAKSTEKRV